MRAGYLLGLSSFGWPLVIGGGLNSLYDLLLLSMFRKVRPPEEEVVVDVHSDPPSSEEVFDPSISPTRTWRTNWSRPEPEPLIGGRAGFLRRTHFLKFDQQQDVVNALDDAADKQRPAKGGEREQIARDH